MPTTPTMTASYLRRICRCTVFVSIFLLLMDSRLRPSFLRPSSSDSADRQQTKLIRVRRDAVPEIHVKDSAVLVRNVRQKSATSTAAPEEIEEADEGKVETEDAEADDPGPSEKGDEEEDSNRNEEEETEAPATKRPSKTTRRASTMRTSTSKRSKVTEKDDDDEDNKTTITTDSTSSINTTDDDQGTTSTEAAVEPKCTLPAIRQFPPDIFDQEERRYGGLIVHLLVVVYTFFCLAVICDDYFCGSLEMVCKRLNLSEDVAGATLMAAGSSAPELFTSMVGVFVAKGDVGTGTIVGSAVFNILFVVGTCAFFSQIEGTQLSWWPVVRDTTFYCIAIMVLIATLFDGEVTWYESLIMLILYGVYVFAMKYNTRAYEFVAQKTGWSGPVQGVEETSRLSGTGRFDKPVFSGYEQFADEADNFQENGLMSPQKPTSLALPTNDRMLKHQGNSFEMVQQEFEKWRIKPVPGSKKTAFARWILMYPIYFVLYYTIPDCKKEKYAKWYIATFVISIIWIAVFSYIMVWMVTVIGHTLSIPDSIMGITFLAAGTSIPDAMASLIVARQGMADMAVSNSIGSNVFDILIGLALPWFLSTSMIRPGRTVTINSNGLIYNAVLLFITVGVAVGGLRSTGWKLTRRVGMMFYVTYGVYLILAVMIEYNVFGLVNAPMCSDEEADIKERLMLERGE